MERAEIDLRQRDRRVSLGIRGKKAGLVLSARSWSAGASVLV
jgi:hypothetical protein